jgi:hypothetical protein
MYEVLKASVLGLGLGTTIFEYGRQKLSLIVEKKGFSKTIAGKKHLVLSS